MAHLASGRPRRPPGGQRQGSVTAQFRAGEWRLGLSRTPVSRRVCCLLQNETKL